MSPPSYVRHPEEERSYHSDWLKRSRVNYFACFMELWVGFNAWFKDEIGETQDRKCINQLKDADSVSNELYKIFETLIESDFKEAILFRGNIEALYYTLNSANIKYDFGPKSKSDPTKTEQKIISFRSALIDFSKKKYESGYQDLFHSFKEDRVADIAAGVDDEEYDYDTPWIELDEVRFINEPKIIFSALIEIIYQIRCKLFHGSMNPEDQAHYYVVKHCYELLQEMASRIKTPPSIAQEDNENGEEDEQTNS